MTRTLTITYDNSNEDGAALCVADDSIFFNTRIIKIFTGEKAEQLYKELTGQCRESFNERMNTRKMESEEKNNE